MFVYHGAHINQMGNCDWLPEPGDLCIRVADAGDHFHHYVAVRKTKGRKYRRVGKFGAYEFGKALLTLDERTFHLACAGEPVIIDA